MWLVEGAERNQTQTYLWDRNAVSVHMQAAIEERHGQKNIRILTSELMYSNVSRRERQIFEKMDEIHKTKNNIYYLGSPIIIIVLYVALNNNSELLADKIWDGFIVIWALFIILYGMIENCYNILGLANSKNEEWKKYLIFIDKKMRGNLIGMYVIDGHLYHDKIKRQYGDYFRHFNAKSFATLIHFKSTNKYMLITEMDWVEGVDVIYNDSL